MNECTENDSGDNLGATITMGTTEQQQQNNRATHPQKSDYWCPDLYFRFKGFKVQEGCCEVMDGDGEDFELN